MTRRGFTLIELLVVIAIIAILAAILFPVFARARAKALQNNCLSNVKQLTLGIIMYASDYDEKFPPLSSPGLGCSNQADWAGGIFPYVKNTQIYVCPSNSGNSAVTCPTQGINTLDYAMNEGIMAISQTSVTQPASVLALLEGARGSNSMAFSAGDVQYVINNPGWGGESTPFYRRHMDGANYGFVDGHAKWQRIETIGATSTTALNGAAGTFGAWFAYNG